MLRQSLSLFLVIMIASSAACGFPQASRATCVTEECCCCSSHKKTTKNEQDSCGCRIEQPSPAPVSADEFLPFTPSVPLVTIADHGMTIFSNESAAHNAIYTAWQAPPPLRRLHQRICVYVI